MQEGWSKWHRMEHKDEQRSRQAREDRQKVGISDDDYERMKGWDNFVVIMGVALNRGISWYAAEAVYYDERREAEKAKLREQLNVAAWQGDGSPYTYNEQYSFGDELELKHRLGGHFPKRGPLSKGPK